MDARHASSAKPRRTTAIFAKQPAPGSVKTRLCPPLSPAQAAELAQAMLADVVERLLRAAEFETALCFAPPESRGWFEAAFPALSDLRPQVGANLGRRLAHYFEQELSDGAGSTAVAIGSDAPLVATDAIARAHDALAGGADVVLGPDAGGGYYLVGLRAPHTEIFDVELSTPDVLEHTLARARARGLAVALIEASYDIDVERDLERLRAELGALAPDAPVVPRRTAECLASFSRR